MHLDLHHACLRLKSSASLLALLRQVYKYILTPIGKGIAWVARGILACIVAIGSGFWKYVHT